MFRAPHLKPFHDVMPFSKFVTFRIESRTQGDPHEIQTFLPRHDLDVDYFCGSRKASFGLDWSNHWADPAGDGRAGATDCDSSVQAGRWGRQFSGLEW